MYESNSKLSLIMLAIQFKLECLQPLVNPFHNTDTVVEEMGLSALCYFQVVDWELRLYGSCYRTSTKATLLCGLTKLF